MSDKSAPQTPKTVALYERLIETIPEIDRKGATTPYTSLNGHMFSLLTKEGHMALRLPFDVREAFIKKYASQITIQYGRTMKEYVDVPDVLLERTDELKAYLQLSFDYIGTLKPKATKKKRPS